MYLCESFEQFVKVFPRQNLLVFDGKLFSLRILFLNVFEEVVDMFAVKSETDSIEALNWTIENALIDLGQILCIKRYYESYVDFRFHFFRIFGRSHDELSKLEEWEKEEYEKGE